jgi:hypothetical protein
MAQVAGSGIAGAGPIHLGQLVDRLTLVRSSSGCLFPLDTCVQTALIGHTIMYSIDLTPIFIDICAAIKFAATSGIMARPASGLVRYARRFRRRSTRRGRHSWRPSSTPTRNPRIQMNCGSSLYGHVPIHQAAFAAFRRDASSRRAISRRATRTRLRGAIVRQ